MPLYFIAGTAGTGKTTTCRALKEWGYEAYDVDADGYAGWQNIQTGYRHPKSTVKTADRTPDFLRVHSWRVPRDKVVALREKTGKRPAFLCGDIGNEEELKDLFDGMFALHVDDKTLIKRLSSRTGNDWGGQPHELQSSLKKHHSSYEKYRAWGAVIVDATQPVEKVVEDIVGQVNDTASS